MKSLKWRRMSVTSSQITGNWTVCSTSSSGQQQKKPQSSTLLTLLWVINSLAPGKSKRNFSSLIFQIIFQIMIDGWGISCELALRWMSLDLTDDKSTLVHVMACCRQATSHYLSQCWPRSLSPYGISMPLCRFLIFWHYICSMQSPATMSIWIYFPG